ncbi:MAG: MBL fold metallo-hydrolase, partial [Clostridia bacterium]|nr:MBL fold metallo-hydrolase [Clostridia bacterium]
SLPDIEIEAVFLPVNGVGNNMNMKDAARFARRVNAKYTVPVHFGMFDKLTAENITLENAVIPKLYESICLE